MAHTQEPFVGRQILLLASALAVSYHVVIQLGLIEKSYLERDVQLGRDRQCMRVGHIFTDRCPLWCAQILPHIVLKAGLRGLDKEF